MTMKEKLCKSLWVQFLFLYVIGILIYNASIYAEDAGAWMPDPALRVVVSEQLGVENFTQADMLQLHNLIAVGRNIIDLKGLEHAKNLGYLNLGGNQISDLRPLAGLTHLETLGLWSNQIKDVSPLAGLVNLRVLFLRFNQIADISPLVGLANLENLEIHGNEAGVLSTIPLSKVSSIYGNHKSIAWKVGL